MKSIVLILLLCSVTSCTPKPPDVPVCENLAQHLVTDPETEHLLLQSSPTCEKQIGEVSCGHCTYIVSGREIYVGEKPGHFLNGKPWSQIKAESIYVPAVESYGPLADYIIDSCAKLKCNQAVDEFKVKVIKTLDLNLESP